jgi:hypothetical protein
MELGRGCLNSFCLKMIAIVTMLIDHIGAVLYPGEMIFRYIGRISFPIFLFLMVEGFYHTRNVRKYEVRMVIFAFISEIPFDLAFSGTMWNPRSQNVFFTLAIGLIMMDLLQKWNDTMWKQACVIAACIIGAELLCTDYGGAGILMIFFFYKYRDNWVVKLMWTGIISLICFSGTIECFCIIAFLPILLYNGKKGPSLKYAFYAFYPAHLLILYLISTVGILGISGGLL